MDAVGNRVAVVGLGALGLVAVKNLLEEGFDVTGFDSNAYVGGLWRFTEDDKTSVLASTVVNICKEVNCFTDFPFPRDAPSHCTAAQVADYMESYADHFHLRPHLRLSTSVTKIKRDAVSSKWILEIEDGENLMFDRVVVATGMNSATHTPSVPGMDKFAGDTVHSRAFKKPEQLAGKRVVVVGLSYTGADTIDALRGIAKEIYISHKHGAIVAPREIDGKSLGHAMTLRKLAFASFLESHLPAVHEKMMNVFLAKIQNKCFTLQPEWRLSPAPSIKHALPIISDTLIANFAGGHVTSIPGIASILDSHTLQLDDGSKLEVDSIIWCTGYRSDFSMLDDSADPTRRTAERWAKAAGSRGKPLPRLYQNVLSEDYPESLAFLGHVAYSTGAFVLYDLASMAVTQIWKGRSALPAPREIKAQIDEHHAWISGIAEQGPVVPAWVKRGEWLDWVDEVAGTGIREHLGWGSAGWAFWWKDAEMQKMLMDGICSPHAYRLFEGTGKRKAWEGAREEIYRVNEEAKAQGQSGVGPGK